MIHAPHSLRARLKSPSSGRVPRTRDLQGAVFGRNRKYRASTGGQGTARPTPFGRALKSPSRACCFLLLISLAVSSVGCLGLKPTTDPTRFYLLTAESKARASSGDRQLSLGRTELPDHLRSPQIAVRVSPNEVRYAGLHHWAEPLEEAIPRALRQNLLSILGSDNFHAGVPPTGFDGYELRVAVLRFDVEPSGKAVAEVVCRIVGSQEHETRWQAGLRFEEEFVYDPRDFTAATVALSRSVRRLSAEIAEQLFAFPE